MPTRVVTRIQRAKTGRWCIASDQHNVQTQDGINWMSEVLGNQWGDLTATASSPIQMAVTEDTGAPSASDQSLPAELTANGMSRLTATYSHTADNSSFTQTASWNNAGSTITVAKAGLCSTLTSFEDAISLDTHFAITAVSPVAVLDSSDTLEIAWGIHW